MKKITFFLLLAAMMLSQTVRAQDTDDKNFFNHLGVGLSIGTEGPIGFDLAVPVCNYMEVRAGMSFWPGFKYSTDIKAEDPPCSTVVTYTNFPTTWVPSPDGKVNVEGKASQNNFKVLFDIYPTKTTSFHFTVGAYMSRKTFLTVQNTEPFLRPSDWGTAGLQIGDYDITSDETGTAKADLRVSKFKPYVGIGFGRAVPKGRIGCNFDLGVQFWGSPSVYSRDWNGRMVKLESNDKDSDEGKALNTISKMKVFPVLSFRICGRIL